MSVAKAQGHAIIIHEGGDNYSDTPKPLGGGGSRIACGVVE
jgi:Cu-Zn family superoxide dismutase